MLADPWAIALMVTGAIALFLLGGTLPCALRVLRHWNPEADDRRQIALESQTWLAALLVRYALLLQIFSLFLLLAAASSFAKVLAGAMCAAGAFAANPLGLPALLVKIVAIFLSAWWLVLHHLDLSSEHSPLTRIKFTYLLLLSPLLLVDGGLVSLYLVQLEPDIVTSCCGVLFSPGGTNQTALLTPLESLPRLPVFLALATALLIAARLRQRRASATFCCADCLLLLGCPLFFFLALAVVTYDISPYIYALPSHRCPFDLFDRATGYIGFPLYASLFLATFVGAGSGAVAVFSHLPGLTEPTTRIRRLGLRVFLIFLPLFLLLCLWHPSLYFLRGGE